MYHSEFSVANMVHLRLIGGNDDKKRHLLKCEKVPERLQPSTNRAIAIKPIAGFTRTVGVTLLQCLLVGIHSLWIVKKNYIDGGKELLVVGGLVLL